jgi:Arc-like DNA binding domain
MARRKPADTVHLRLRFPEKLRRRIEAAATKNQQSMNAEIVERLERSFGQEDITATIEATADATAHAVAEHFVVLMGGKPVVMEVDYTQDPGGALRGWKVPTGDEAKALLRRPHMEVGRESPTPKLEPGKTSKEGKSK